MTEETQRTISDWGVETFGPHSPLSFATRMNVETAELLSLLASPPPLDDPGEAGRTMRENYRSLVRGELADVYIVLVQVATAAGVSLADAVQEKMAVNRARQWERLPSGRFQHAAED